MRVYKVVGLVAMSLPLTQEYVHPLSFVARKIAGPVEPGAYEFVQSLNKQE